MDITGDRLDEDGKHCVEQIEFWKRDPIECLKELMGNPEFKDGMCYTPEQVFF